MICIPFDALDHHHTKSMENAILKRSLSKRICIVSVWTGQLKVSKMLRNFNLYRAMNQVIRVR